MSILNKILPNKILIYQLYIFQLEEYSSLRFVKAITKKGLFVPNSLRKKPKYTKKALLLILLTLIQQILINLMLLFLVFFATNSIIFSALTFLICLYISFIFSFIFLTQSADIIFPIEFILKGIIIKKAKNKLKELKNLTIIGITGSYGKTTTKETIFKFLESDFNVVKTEGNNNTPLGIANTILKKLNNKTDIFVVEMGEYVKGDVKALCDIAKPNIAIITGINEAHLERYKSMENAISTKFEIVENAAQNAQIILNADDELIVNNYKKYVKDLNSLKFYSSKNSQLCDYKITEYKFNEHEIYQEFKVIYKNNLIANVKTKVLANYILGNIIAGFIVASEFKVNQQKFAFLASSIAPVEHRLNAKLNKSLNILIIDDTYNGNSNGVLEGLNLLKNFKNRRKVYVTPGLVETGFLQEKIHLDLSKEIAKIADLVILVKTSSTKYIYKGLIDNGFLEDKIIWYYNSKVIWEDLYKNLNNNDVVLLQNDWSDNYV